MVSIKNSNEYSSAPAMDCPNLFRMYIRPAPYIPKTAPDAPAERVFADMKNRVNRLPVNPESM